MKKIIKHDIAINKNCNYLPDCIQNFRKNASRTRLLTKWSAFCEEGDLGLTARLAIIVNQVKRVQKMKKNEKKWQKMTQKWQVQVYKYSLFSVFELNLTRSLSIAIFHIFLYIVREFNFTLIQRTQRKSAALDLRSQCRNLITTTTSTIQSIVHSI